VSRYQLYLARKQYITLLALNIRHIFHLGIFGNFQRQIHVTMVINVDFIYHIYGVLDTNNKFIRKERIRLRYSSQVVGVICLIIKFKAFQHFCMALAEIAPLQQFWGMLSLDIRFKCLVYLNDTSSHRATSFESSKLAIRCKYSDAQTS
jgi:hypothetical protein